MAAYIRVLSTDDLDRCSVVESAAFPPAEAATREKVRSHIWTEDDLADMLFLASPSFIFLP